MLRVRDGNRKLHLPAPYTYKYDSAGRSSACETGTVKVDSSGRKYHTDLRFRTAKWSEHIELIGLPSKPWDEGGLGNGQRSILNTEVQEGHETVHGEKVVSAEFLGFLGTLADVRGDGETSMESVPLGTTAKALGDGMNASSNRPAIWVRLPSSSTLCVKSASGSDACR